jgi:FAD/FMN-containing dehydrogenase/NAD-dependent dihydropyrimidine dehydrogenase PreA subunit
MAIRLRDLEQLMARIGRENVLTSEADRIVYSTDVGAPPGIVDLLVKRKADAIARCRSIEDVQTAIQWAKHHRIPLTPRAAATNALGGSVPKRRGLVLDLTPMNKRIEIDEKTLIVTVDAGVVIADLQKRLNDVGLELPCYPTSALAATIGGFVSMDGHGINSTRSGNIGRAIVELEGVGADGERFHARDKEQMQFLIGLGGSTGVITSIRLKAVEATTDKPVLVTVPDYAALQAVVQEATTKWKLKHVMFHNDDFFTLRTEAIGARKNPFANKHAVILTFAEKDYAAAKDDVERMAKRNGGDVADDKTSADEWAQRFYPIRAKKLGPSLVAGEVFVPVSNLAHYLRQLTTKTLVPSRVLSVEGHVTDDGRVYFFIFALDDERRPTYPLGWGTSAWILALAKRMGGTAYHPGVWLQWEAKSVFGANRYHQLKRFKKSTDYRNLMNPGMVFPMPAPIPEFVYKMKIPGPIPAPSLGFQLAAGNPVLQLQGAMFRYRRKKSLGVKAADFAGDSGRGGLEMALLSDEIWGCDLPSVQAIPNPGGLPMTQTVRGKMDLAKAYARGRITDAWSLKPVLDVADPTPEEAKVCLDYAQVQKVLAAFRAAVQAEGIELTVKAVEVKAEAVVTAAGKPAAGHADVAKTGLKTIDVVAVKKQAAETAEEKKAWVLAADCIVCNGCEAACPTNAAIVTDMARVDRDLCIADGACFDACPTGAIRPGIEEKATSGGWPKGSRLAGQFGKVEA